MNHQKSQQKGRQIEEEDEQTEIIVEFRKESISILRMVAVENPWITQDRDTGTLEVLRHESRRDRAALVEALSRRQREQPHHRPVLGCLSLTAEDGILTVASTNAEIGISIGVTQVEVSTAGKALVLRTS